jgi:formylglycine-generating enzyme required for sulfatase activity
MVSLPAGQFLMGSPDSDPDATSMKSLNTKLKSTVLRLGNIQ